MKGEKGEREGRRGGQGEGEKGFSACERVQMHVKGSRCM